MTATERMYEELEKQGKKSADLCRHLAISTSLLAGWKAQNTIPPSKYLVSISEFLGISIDYLLTGIEQKKLPENEQPIVRDEFGEISPEGAHIDLARFRANQALTERIRELIKEELNKQDNNS